MTRRPFIAGNWKMNTRRQAASGLVQALVEGLDPAWGAEVAVCPPFPYLALVADELAGSSIGLGAQNLYPAADGAYTGEINAGMLTDVGCRYVILGHSERRQYFAETDASVAKKVQAALAGNLVPIVCVGETLEQRQSDQTDDVVTAQVRGSLAGLDEVRAAGIVIAYEPVWAIGTGLTATPAQAEAVHAMIRKLLGEIFSPEVAAQIRIQYGGSVKADNAAELLSQPNIDGALVGGASLKAGDFLAIIAAAKSTSA